MKKNVFAPILIVLVIAILGVAGYFAYKNFSQSTFIPPGASSGVSQEYVTDEKPKTGDKDTAPTNDQNVRDIYIQNVQTGEEKFFVTLSDSRGGYHNSEYRAGNLYVIRRTSNSNDPNWTDQLWKYSNPSNGKAIFSEKGLDFRAALDGSIIAIPSGYNELTFINNSGSVLKQFSINDLQLLSDPSYSPTVSVNIMSNSKGNWSKDNNMFWGIVGVGPDIYNFYQVDVPKWKVYKYDSPRGDFGQNEMDLNVNTGKIVYSDFPLFFDGGEYDKFVASKKPVTLFVYGLKTGAKNVITTSNGKPFNPKWVDDNTIEYNNPNGSDRLKYLIK